MSDGRIVIDTDLDSSGIEAGLGKLKGVITKVAAALGVGKLAQEVVNVGKSFEAGMSEVQAISGASGKDLQALTNKAKEMGATTKFSATQSAEALKYMAMAGWKTNDMVDGLGGVMNLAAASGEDLGTVSDIVTDALTAFGLQAKDSGHFADVLAKASSNSNTNVSMMGETFKYVAPLAGSMKYSVKDTATAIGLMANAGIKGSQAGTSLRSMLTRLVKPPKEAAEAMSTLGISVTKSDGSMKPLRETMAELREKFSGLTESQKASYASSIAGQEAMSGLLAIVNTSDKDFDKLTKAIDNSSGAAKKQAETMNQNLQGALYELGSAAESLGIEMYEHIKKPLTKAVDFGAKKVRGLSSALKKGKIEDIVSPESVETVKTLGSAAKTVGSIGLKALGAGAKVAGSGVKLLADNLDKAVPLALSLGTAYKALEISNGVKAGTNAIGRAVKWWDAATVALGHYAEQMEAAKFTGRMYNVELTTSQMILGVFTGQVSIATLATEGFNAAMTALGGPVGIAVAGVTALAVGLTTYAALQNHSSSEEDKLAKSIDKATKSRKEYMKFKGLGKESAKMLWKKIKAELFNKSVTDVKVSGRTMTITKGDGSTSTQTTQDTTYGVVSKSANGLAPKLPDETTTTKYLRQDGTWAVPPDNNTTYSDATQENHGLMSAADKKKLDGVEEGANKYVHPTSSGYKHIPSGGEETDMLIWSEDGTAAWATPSLTAASTQRGLLMQFKMGSDLVCADLLKPATNAEFGVMHPDDKAKLDALPSNSTLESTYAKKSDITGVYRPKGSVADASKLPTSDQQAGDVWSIEADSAFGPAGTNVVWTSDGKWDNLGGIVTMEELTQADIDEICV